MIARRILFGSLVTALSVSLTPAIAVAYLSPEQVFQGITPPPTQREADDIAKNRQAEINRDRAAAQDALPSTEDVPAEEEPALQPAAPTDPQMEEVPSLLEDEGRWDRRQERLNDGGNGGTTIIIQNGGEVIRDRKTGEILHSGAPRITGTGPAEWLAAIALFVAATGTFVFARWREGRLMRK